MRANYSCLLKILAVSAFPSAIATPQQSNAILPPTLISAVPVCIQDCLLRFVSSTANRCGQRPSLQCLCSTPNFEYTLGEYSILCLGWACPPTDSQDYQLQQRVGSVCQGQRGALQATHSVLSITPSSLPSSTTPTTPDQPPITIQFTDITSTTPNSTTTTPPTMSTTPNFAPTTLTLGTASTAAPPLPFPTSSASNIASAQSSTSSMADSTQKPKLANGVIAGIVGGGVLGVCLLVGSILLFVYCRRRRQEKIQGEEKKPLPSSFRPKPRPRSNSDKSLTSLGARDSASHFPQPPSFRHTKWPGQSPSTPLTGVSFPPDTPRTPASHNGSTRTISELLPPRPVFTNTPPMPMPLYKTHANGTSTPKSRNNGDISPWDAQDHKAMAAARATMWPTPSTPPQVPPKEPKYDPRGLSVRSDIGPYNSSHSKGLESSVSGHGSSTSLAKSRSSTAPHSTTYTILPHIATAVATAQPVNFSQPTSIHRANTGASSVYSRPDHSNSQPPSPKRAEPLPSVPAPLRIRTPGRPTVTTRTGLPLNHHHQRMLPMHAKTYSGVSASSTNSHPYAPHPSPALHAPASFTKLSLSPLQSQYSTYSPYTPEQSPEEHSYLRSRARDSVQSMHTHIDDDDGVFEEVGLTTVVESPSPVGAVQYPEIPPSGSPVRSAPQTPKSANSGDHPGARAQWGQPAKPYAPRRLEREESYSGGRF